MWKALARKSSRMYNWISLWNLCGNREEVTDAVDVPTKEKALKYRKKMSIKKKNV